MSPAQASSTQPALTVAALIRQLQQVPDQSAPVVLYIDGVEYRIGGVSVRSDGALEGASDDG